MTRIHRPRQADDLAEFAIEEELQHVAQSSGSKVLVFPEGAVRLWTDATDAFWAPVISDAGKTLLIGAGQPIPASARYYNSVVIVGDHSRTAFHQRIPVPGGMWNPFYPQGGVEIDILGPGTIDIAEHRAAILICYEQLLTWPMLRSAIEKPTILIAISNEAWTAATTVPRMTHVRSRVGQTIRFRNLSNQFMRGDPNAGSIERQPYPSSTTSPQSSAACNHASHPRGQDSGIQGHPHCNGPPEAVRRAGSTNG